MQQRPYRLVDLSIRFLNQEQGTLSKRARQNEFSSLKPDEILILEKNTLKSLRVIVSDVDTSLKFLYFVTFYRMHLGFDSCCMYFL